MSDLRRDPIVGRWVIVNSGHPLKPQDYEKEEHTWRQGECPFCYGNESLTPPEIDVIRNPKTQANTPGWQVRVVANKFPALRIEGELERHGVGMYDMSNGVGAHEVIIESPYHHKDIPDLLNNEIENIITLWCRRTIDLAKDKRFKYIMLFKNYGPSAGASLEHPHSQIIALPMIPKNVHEELLGAEEYFGYRERCIFCDILRQETQDKERIIIEDKYFMAFCPFVSRFPFEIWIVPKKHSGYYCQMSKEEIPSLANILKEVIGRVKNILPSPAYNFIMHSSPINGDASDSYHWHIELMPKLTRVAGFEWGSGFYLVPTPPESAARYLKGIEK
ncbi:MAG: galactose-1-phosphate uridylyltransferase [Candidatus Omnitrophica bacterium]|nr:galactose-1-phosphate uridylyltransferase [Candidatus Omnitrophota bacterium]MDD5610199.1 galactose-1-phosphate uridylyltransferase [Candidatus Omnitrophota bacterium]